MKNKLFVIFLLLLSTTFVPAFAEKFHVELVESVDLAHPQEVVSVRMLDKFYFTDYDMLEKGAIIKGQIKKIVPTRRLERDAYIVFVLVSYTVPAEADKEILFSSPKKTKLRKIRKLDRKDVTANTVGTALSCFPPFSLAVPVVQFTLGAVNHRENEHPFKAGGRYLVESWPFCYFLKGKEIPVQQGAKLEISLDERIFKPAKVKSEAL